MTRKILLLTIFALILFLNSISIFAQWERQDGGVKNILRDISFIDTSNGIAVGDNGTIVRTFDSGKNWILPEATDTINTLLKVQLISKDIAYIIGMHGTILKTTDGGNKWISLNDSLDYDFRDLSFINENEGWIAARFETNGSYIGAIFYTTDGGKTFSKQIEIESANPAGAKFFHAIKFQDKFKGWALASDYFDNFSSTFLYGTEDGGSNWKLVNSIASIPVTDIKVIHKDTLWLGGGSFAKFIKTFDGGITLNYSWYDTIYAREIAPLSGLSGWASHRKPTDFYNYNQIMFTSDGGATWNEEYRVKETVLGMCTINNYLWAVGVEGLILKKTPLKTSVNENQKVSIEQPTPIQNYPNPFNLQTNITYQLISQSDVEITIYNLIGEIIVHKKFYSQLPGQYSFKWEGKDGFDRQLPSGIYLCNLSVISKKELSNANTIKMLLIK